MPEGAKLCLPGGLQGGRRRGIWLGVGHTCALSPLGHPYPVLALQEKRLRLHRAGDGRCWAREAGGCFSQGMARGAVGSGWGCPVGKGWLQSLLVIRMCCSLFGKSQEFLHVSLDQLMRLQPLAQVQLWVLVCWAFIVPLLLLMIRAC